MGDTDIIVNKKLDLSLDVVNKTIKQTSVEDTTPVVNHADGLETKIVWTKFPPLENTAGQLKDKESTDVATESNNQKQPNDRIPTLYTGSLDAECPPQSRRRHVRRNLFEDELLTDREIFSVKGTKTVKLNRRRDNVTVFPSGCMGIEDKLVENEESVLSPRRHLNPLEMQVPETRHIGLTPKRRPSSAQPDAIHRNPLTGEGYQDSDFIRGGTLKKKDGNPLLGEGYKDKPSTKSSKIPPGGYSKGLW